MNNNLDEMLKEAPSLTLEPFAPADTAENSLLPVKEEETRVPEVVLTPPGTENGGRLCRPD